MTTFQLLLKYFRHVTLSFHLHGIHSPFVYEFEKRCLRDKEMKSGYGNLSRFRESLQNNHTLLHVEDHGAGSRIFKTNQRRVKDILKTNSTTTSRSRLLYRIAQYFEVDRVLELGTSLGIGTHALAIARPEAQISTIEGASEIARFTQEHLEQTKIKNITVLSGTFQDFLDGALEEQPSGTYDLIFIDGHHNGAATIKYFEQLLPYSHNDTIFILDDINWSTEMSAAWDQLCGHSQVTASIDTFFWGFLFLRKEQLQERFHILL
jgi:predicted O-methyltransferase YrrM